MIKKRASSFSGTPLAGYLRTCGVDTILVTGVIYLAIALCLGGAVDRATPGRKACGYLFVSCFIHGVEMQG